MLKVMVLRLKVFLFVLRLLQVMVFWVETFLVWP